MARKALGESEVGGQAGESVQVYSVYTHRCRTYTLARFSRRARVSPYLCVPVPSHERVSRHLRGSVCVSTCGDFPDLGPFLPSVMGEPWEATTHHWPGPAQGTVWKLLAKGGGELNSSSREERGCSCVWDSQGQGYEIPVTPEAPSVPKQVGWCPWWSKG